MIIIQPQAGEFSYSGLHDHGPLIPPKEGGPMALLIGCVQAAKEYNDRFLTECIQQHEKNGEQSDAGDSPDSKKPKLTT